MKRRLPPPLPPLAVIALALAAAAGPARAQAPADTRSYAIVVGSNPGGEGQETLRFAERDAASIAAVLKDLGGYPAGNITLLAQPRASQVLAALDRVESRVLADHARGLQSVVLFYYSGHARAAALELGRDELPLTVLRERIDALPATLKVVILDACQSGAFSGIKGVEPAADFSYNSVARLDAAGVAVMASSSSTELSQESERLGASYFTHHLLVALRGAGDTNRDGKVSLDEAYRYAYHRTLASTARTAVGRQHVTLETDLKGKGEVPLTYPAKADARLGLPASLVADIVVQSGDAIIAEVHKARGAIELALPRGSYRLLVRQGDRLQQCDLALPPGRTTALDLTGCRHVAI
ncbi:MAG TPA: caspase family protein, partial [Kofleriaceae bacterium]|nr:caspase family protein [Kofleriaceae bacterium]